ncbi:MAG TPA: hypothetical protein VG738_23455 [Chitinophagaceae bacterium]|nr:hypothetical protein [Chitinophagaceae bacterium]
MVEVFKTNVQKQKQAKQLAAVLRQCFPGSKINFDLEDCDKVLRVEANNLLPNKVITVVIQNGFACNILEQ